MTRPLLLALLLAAACKHSSSSSTSAHTETSTVTDSTSSETGAVTTTTTQSEGPGKTTTTVDEFAPPKEGDASESEHSGSSAADAGGVPATLGVVSRPSHGPLVRRTVTVTEHGAETTETHQQATTQAQGASETKAAGKVDTTAKGEEAGGPAASCVSLGWLWGIVIIAVVMVAWRLLRKV